MWDAEYVGPDSDIRKGSADSSPLPIRASTEYIDNPPMQPAWFDGSKFDGDFGPTQLYAMDYETLRARSSQLFRENMYARGLIRRLATNIINTGLQLEATPDESVIGVQEDSLSDWAEDTENRFFLYTKSPALCDYSERKTLGQKQVDILTEAMISGDCLCVLHQNPITGTPGLEVISGSRIHTPLNEPASGNEIVHGVERDSRGRHVAYWVQQEDGTAKPVQAIGKKSKRRIAWMVYGTDKRTDDVRGTPLLGIILQSIKEIDRYRDSTQRKATINSILAFFIEKTQDKPGTRPVGAGATLKGSVSVSDSEGTARKMNLAKMNPGIVFEELQHGEKPTPFSTAGTDINFGAFEAAVIHAIAWTQEIPPEILTLAFSSNYSASQAATNEFKMYLNKERMGFGETVLQPIYTEWLIGEVLSGRIIAPGFLDARRDPVLVYVYAAWISSDWSGAIKPSIDMVKAANAYGILVDRGWITNARAARELTGTKFSKNVKRQKRENELLIETRSVLGELATIENAIEDTPVEDLDAADEVGAKVVSITKEA